MSTVGSHCPANNPLTSRDADPAERTSAPPVGQRDTQVQGACVPTWSVTGSPPTRPTPDFLPLVRPCVAPPPARAPHPTDDTLWNGRGQPCEFTEIPVGTAVDSASVTHKHPTGCQDRVAMTPALRRLHPAPPTPITIADAYDDRAPATPDRPWIGLCMVTSLDGSVVDRRWRPAALGQSERPRRSCATLRRIADMVLVGAGTVRGEGYGPPTKRRTNGSASSPTAVVSISAAELFTSRSRIPDRPRVGRRSTNRRVQVLRAGDDERRSRRRRRAASTRSCRSSDTCRPRAARSSTAPCSTDDLIDELDLTISPRLVGGDGPRLTRGATEIDRRFELAHLLADDEGFVFSRWVRRAC